jgi:hypothetical protein
MMKRDPKTYWTTGWLPGRRSIPIPPADGHNRPASRLEGFGDRFAGSNVSRWRRFHVASLGVAWAAAKKAARKLNLAFVASLDRRSTFAMDFPRLPQKAAVEAGFAPTINLAASKMSRKTRSRTNKASNKASNVRLPMHPQNAQRKYERYLELARTEAQGGDLVAAENYLQHAEHYLRSMHESGNANGTRRNQGTH